MFRDAQKCRKSPIRLSVGLVHPAIPEASVGLFGSRSVRGMRAASAQIETEAGNWLASPVKPLAEPADP
jgi:hypothetical protein